MKTGSDFLNVFLSVILLTLCAIMSEIHLFNRIVESYNISDGKGPVSIIKFDSLLLLLKPDHTTKSIVQVLLEV